MANVLLRASALAVAAFALALLYLRSPESGARADRPLCEHCNVILISFDTVRSDHLGAYGYERATSPNVDALAKKSVLFERAISQAPWTLPAHASMLSGLYPSRLGVLRYPATRILSDQNTVLPEVFRSAGYATAGFTGGGFVSYHYGFDRGFDQYISRGRRYEHNLDSTIDWLEEHKDKPFFLFFHGYDAHRPYYSKAVDKKEMGLPADSDVEQPRYCLQDDRGVPDDAKREHIVRYYDASIHHGDRAIGVLLQTLDQLHLMDNTVILLTSDHGEEFFEHGNCDHVRFLYNESIHVPYMVYIPGFSPQGMREEGLIPASISVARTLLDIVGIEHAMPGVTLLPMLMGKQKGFPVVYSEADSAAGSLGSRGRAIAITKPTVKLISYIEEGNDEAYDLKEDPDEHHPLPEKNLAYLLRQTLRAWSDSLKPLPRPAAEPDEVAKAIAADDGDDSTGESADKHDDRPKESAPAQPPGQDGDKGKAPGRKNPKMPEDLKKDLKSLGYLQ
ncbi:MAG TPA: sulfatase [Candidatus Binatia bacterium]